MTTLRELRERKLLTQEELARQIGLSSGAIYKMESGKTKRPRYSVLRKLGEVFEVDPLSIEFTGQGVRETKPVE